VSEPQQDWSDSTWLIHRGVERLDLDELRTGALYQALQIERMRKELMHLRQVLAHRPHDHATAAHGHGCWSWGPDHFMCAVQEINRLKNRLKDC
jgi:hypothetical protein